MVINNNNNESNIIIISYYIMRSAVGVYYEKSSRVYVINTAYGDSDSKMCGV